MLNTTGLPLGPYDQTITLRTSDPANPERTVRVVGTIIAGTPDTPPGAMQRPLDWTLAVPGSHSQGEWVEFTHTRGPEPQSLHPAKVYSQDYGTLWGVGKYATPFGGTSSADMFGDGRDGDRTVAATENLNLYTQCSGTAGSTTLIVASTAGFGSGDMILIHQSRGINDPNWEINKVSSIGAGSLTLASPLKRTYADDGSITGGGNQSQCIRIPQYRNLTINGTVTPPDFDDPGTGGIVAVAVASQMVVNGNINVDGEKGRSHYWGANDPMKGGGYWGGWVAQSNANDKLAGIQGMGWGYWSGAPGGVRHGASYPRQWKRSRWIQLGLRCFRRWERYRRAMGAQLSRWQRCRRRDLGNHALWRRWRRCWEQSLRRQRRWWLRWRRNRHSCS